MLEVQSHRNTCFDCGNEPVSHWWAYVWDVANVPMSALQYNLWQVPLYKKIDLVRSWVMSRLLPLHYIASYYLGVVKFTPVLDEELSNRAKVMWQAALDRGAEIEMGQVYGKSRELFRVRFLRNSVQSGSQQDAQKTRWFYFRSLPLVPWKDRTYTQWIDDKFLLKEFLRKEHVHVPLCRSVKTLEEAQAAMRVIQEERRNKKEERNEMGDMRNETGLGTLAATAHELVPVVVKPRQGSRSRHTTINVATEEEMNSAFMKSRVIAHHIMVEEQLFGKVCRATLVGKKLVGFCAMTHAQVVGNGAASIGELIREKNDKRNKRVQSELSLENPDVYPLREKGYTLDTVLPAGEVFELKQRAGWMYGGEGREMVNDVHPQLVKTLERAAELLGAQLVAFDLVIDDPESDPAPQQWGIIETNSVPYIEVHIMPTVGERVNVGLVLWDMWKEIPKMWR